MGLFGKVKHKHSSTSTLIHEYVSIDRVPMAPPNPHEYPTKKKAKDQFQGTSWYINIPASAGMSPTLRILNPPMETPDPP